MQSNKKAHLNSDMNDPEVPVRQDELKPGSFVQYKELKDANASWHTCLLNINARTQNK